jgi:hypothetical protein
MNNSDIIFENLVFPNYVPVANFHDLDIPLWDKLQLPFYKAIDLGNYTFYMTMGMLAEDGRRFVVGIEGYACYGFEAHSIIYPSYVEEKLGCGEGDSGNVADFINCQIGKADIRCPIFGKYRPEVVLYLLNKKKQGGFY